MSDKTGINQSNGGSDELAWAKARIKELKALIQAGDYGQRKTVETTTVESRDEKGGLRVVVTEVTSFAPRDEFAIESPRAPGDFGYPGPIRTVELPPLWSPSMDTENRNSQKRKHSKKGERA